ncbi:hypothetical protein BKA70DRAFT_1452164 [Coprinopsis sp. MPI-PUGE-AT-0042]|nr:hypothetical protein BKA70DRAFT_1452164 [Coprinopsis sp. MPI-PUGE-AT-0042]
MTSSTRFDPPDDQRLKRSPLPPAPSHSPSNPDSAEPSSASQSVHLASPGLTTSLPTQAVAQESVTETFDNSAPPTQPLERAPVDPATGVDPPELAVSASQQDPLGPNTSDALEGQPLDSPNAPQEQVANPSSLQVQNVHPTTSHAPTASTQRSRLPLVPSLVPQKRKGLHDEPPRVYTARSQPPPQEESVHEPEQQPPPVPVNEHPPPIIGSMISQDQGSESYPQSHSAQSKGLVPLSSSGIPVDDSTSLPMRSGLADSLNVANQDGLHPPQACRFPRGKVYKGAKKEKVNAKVNPPPKGQAGKAPSRRKRTMGLPRTRFSQRKLERSQSVVPRSGPLPSEVRQGGSQAGDVAMLSPSPTLSYISLPSEDVGTTPALQDALNISEDIDRTLTQTPRIASLSIPDPTQMQSIPEEPLFLPDSESECCERPEVADKRKATVEEVTDDNAPQPTNHRKEARGTSDKVNKQDSLFSDDKEQPQRPILSRRAALDAI